MIGVVQRVSQATVAIDGQMVGAIGKGLLIFLGVEDLDNEEDIQWLAKKIAYLRIFSDEEEKMNLSAVALEAEFLVISQFTLHASTKKGNRPSFIKAAKPEIAALLYEQFLNVLANYSIRPLQTGRFGADMQVSLVNDGPVTIIIDTKNKQ
ncbi:MAG: D-tyrosyl-tRNA(Tyr) deacylase [Flammeovirgaceae bacterium]|jgi:D-aminoacyl-tRNA deacylase|nr:D-tyrosyl-tRNA(Tyr) deacylase [Flammeovirgaceae bacterium]|tara:strand:- start:11503 stop:11955 length:453 start_codon:yes stop_codon:yes gene_type:complete